jgi:predicted nucleic acid-binding protein
VRILLDTNIVIHRETARVVREDIGKVFRWLDRLRFEKCVHPVTVAEIERYADKDVVRSFGAKIQSYQVLQTVARDTDGIANLRSSDNNPNDQNDTTILAELAAKRVDFLLTEDRGIHRKASAIGVAHLVLTIDSFLEKVTAENPEQSDYKVLSVHRKLCGDVDIRDRFFDSFRTDYPGFDDWFAKKSHEKAYVCLSDGGQVVAFLYLKREAAGSEDYSDIQPAFHRCDRLKIGTLKVAANGMKLGERFLKIVFDQALRARAEEIYVTLFRTSPAHERLLAHLVDWGFLIHGEKRSSAGVEQVLVRKFRPEVNRESPRLTFPYIARAARKFIVPIYPEYHTELLPDSILNNENPSQYVDDKPHRNALSKVYVSRSVRRDLKSGDIIVFYRTKSGGHGFYTSAATTLGVVEQLVDGIRSVEEFIALCRKRSVFSDDELAKQWNHSPRNRPFVVNFLYVYSFRAPRPNLQALIENEIVRQAPRGFEPLSDSSFEALLRITNADTRLVVN